MSACKYCILLLALSLNILAPKTWAAEPDEEQLQPVTNNGQPWRIGYYEGGEYSEYQKLLIETVKGLMKLGWIEDKVIPEQSGEQTAKLWQWLSRELDSSYIQFVADAHYNAGWDDTERVRTRERILKRLNSRQDLDLMLANGTWAGQDLATDAHQLATIVVNASDPLAAGIIKSVDDSGHEHVHATIDPNLHRRQLLVFHDLVGFKRLGVAYENTVSGRSYAAVDVIEALAKERNYEVVSCHTISDISDTRQAEQSVLECFQKLASRVDAIYVTSQGGVNLHSLPQLVAIANKAGVPTFSQTGPEEVKYGILLSLSRAGYRYIGLFHAKTLARVFNGMQPGELGQLYEEPPKMAVNLKTANRIGFNPPLLLLGAADEIYEEILLDEQAP